MRRTQQPADFETSPNNAMDGLIETLSQIASFTTVAAVWYAYGWANGLLALAGILVLQIK